MVGCLDHQICPDETSDLMVETTNQFFGKSSLCIFTCKMTCEWSMLRKGVHPGCWIVVYCLCMKPLISQYLILLKCSVDVATGVFPQATDPMD